MSTIDQEPMQALSAGEQPAAEEVWMEIDRREEPGYDVAHFWSPKNAFKVVVEQMVMKRGVRAPLRDGKRFELFFEDSSSEELAEIAREAYFHPLGTAALLGAASEEFFQAAY